MRYQIEVLDSARTRVAILTGLVKARLSEKVNGRGLLIVETIEPAEWEHITAGTSFLKVVRREGGSLGTFRVIETRKTRARERVSLAVTARHVLFDTGAELFAYAVNCINYSSAELMEKVLGYSLFSRGTVEPSAIIPFVRFEYEPVLACLQRICDLTGGELLFDEAQDEISLVNHTGADNGVCFQYGVNLRGASRQVLTGSMANRVYGVGGGDPPLKLDEAASSGGFLYAEDADSIAQYGLAEGVCHEPALERVVNLTLTPALDGVYTNGLCENWAKAGNPTLSENTGSDYLLYGKASQHVQATADGQGVEQAVTVDPGGVYQPERKPVRDFGRGAGAGR